MVINGSIYLKLSVVVVMYVPTCYTVVGELVLVGCEDERMR